MIPDIVGVVSSSCVVGVVDGASFSSSLGGKLGFVDGAVSLAPVLVNSWSRSSSCLIDDDPESRLLERVRDATGAGVDVLMLVEEVMSMGVRRGGKSVRWYTEQCTPQRISDDVDDMMSMI